VHRFTVAVKTDSLQTQNGERESRFQLTVYWRKDAEMANFTRKGFHLIGVEGRIQNTFL